MSINHHMSVHGASYVVIYRIGDPERLARLRAYLTEHFHPTWLCDCAALIHTPVAHTMIARQLRDFVEPHVDLLLILPLSREDVVSRSQDFPEHWG